MDIVQIILFLLISVGTIFYLYSWLKQEKKFFWEYKNK